MRGEGMRDADHRVVSCRSAARPRLRQRSRIPMERVIRPEHLPNRRPIGDLGGTSDERQVDLNGSAIGCAMAALANHPTQSLEEPAADAINRDALTLFLAFV